MNNNIKLLLFFILGIFIYVCLHKKLIEGLPDGVYCKARPFQSGEIEYVNSGNRSRYCKGFTDEDGCVTDPYCELSCSKNRDTRPGLSIYNGCICPPNQYSSNTRNTHAIDPYETCRLCLSGTRIPIGLKENVKNEGDTDTVIASAGSDGIADISGDGDPPDNQYVTVGYLNTDRTDCLKCNNGSFQYIDYYHCTRCDYGYTTPNDGKHYWDSNINGRNICTPCPGGQRGDNNGGCRPCQENYFKPSNDIDCQMCPGQKRPNHDKTSCISCPDGYYGQHHQCIQCQPGTYSNHEIKMQQQGGPDRELVNITESCVQCDDDVHYVNINQSACDQTCGPGEQVNENNTGCEPCPRGKISNDDGRCTDCESDSVPNANKTACVHPGSDSLQMISKIFSSTDIQNNDNCESELCLYTAGNDYGCTNYSCESHNTTLNSNWTIKENNESENFYTCNASSRNKLTSKFKSGVRCNKDLCCDNLVCGHQLLRNSNGEILSSCPPGRMIMYNKRCPSKEDCENVNYCCSPPIQSSVRDIYDNILTHSRYVRSDENITIIYGKDIRNFIYFSLMNLEETFTNLEETFTRLSITISDPTTSGHYTPSDYDNLKTALIDLDINNQSDLDKIVLRDNIENITTDSINMVGFRSSEIFNEFLESTRIINQDEETPSDVSQDDIKKFIILLDKPIDNDILGRTPIDYFDYVDSGQGDDAAINEAEFNAHF